MTMKVWTKIMAVLVLMLVVGVLNPVEAQAATTYKNGDVIEITSEEPIDRLYILWDTIPGEWKLTVDGQEFTYGKYEFIHEYVEPGVSGKNWKITIQTEEVILGEYHSFKVGETLPDWVQIWNPPCEDADMVAFPTHADDELLFFGGTLPLYAGELGMDVQVVYLTNHWADAPYRVHELLNGLWTCGVTNYPVMGPFPDLYSKNNLEEAKGMYDTEAIKQFQTWVLRRFKPEVLLSQDINGEYGHSVHMLNTAMMMESIVAANNERYMPEDVEKYGLWDVPKWYIHLYEKNRLTFMWDEPLEAFDGKTGYEVATEAYQCHKSQLKYRPKILRNNSNTTCIYFGLYKTEVGLDSAKNSFFENITVFSDDVIEVPDCGLEPDTGVENGTETDTGTESGTQVDTSTENSTENGTEPDTSTDSGIQENGIGHYIPMIAAIVVVVVTAARLTGKKKSE